METIKHTCTISSKGSLNIDGKKITNLNKITLEQLHRLFEEIGIIKTDESWQIVIKTIRAWYTKQFKCYIAPPQPPKRYIVIKPNLVLCSPIKSCVVEKK